jgi:hypothetical protein
VFDSVRDVALSVKDEVDVDSEDAVAVYDADASVSEDAAYVVENDPIE